MKMVKLTYSILCKIKKKVNAHYYFSLFKTSDNIVSHVNLFPNTSRPIKVLPTVVDCAWFQRKKSNHFLFPKFDEKLWRVILKSQAKSPHLF